MYHHASYWRDWPATLAGSCEIDLFAAAAEGLLRGLRDPFGVTVPIAPTIGKGDNGHHNDCYQKSAPKVPLHGLCILPSLPARLIRQNWLRQPLPSLSIEDSLSYPDSQDPGGAELDQGRHSDPKEHRHGRVIHPGSKDVDRPILDCSSDDKPCDDKKQGPSSFGPRDPQWVSRHSSNPKIQRQDDQGVFSRR